MDTRRFPVDPLLVAPLTVEKYHRMIEVGILGKDDRLELLEGVLVELSSLGPPHAKFISRFNNTVVRLLDSTYRMRIRAPLTLPPFGEPEPDIAIVTTEQQESVDWHPRTALLVVEVASDSLRKDRLIKSRVYARAGVQEYWIADVEEPCIEIYRDPDTAAEQYRSHSIARRGEDVVPQAFPATRRCTGRWVGPDSLG